MIHVVQKITFIIKLTSFFFFQQILQDTVSSLQSSLGDKDSRLSHLNTEVLKIRSSLADVEKRRQQLEELIEEQKNNLTDKDQQVERERERERRSIVLFKF